MKNGLTQSEQETVTAYNNNAEEWASTHTTEGFWKQEREKFRDLLPEGHILEIGTGSGRDAMDLTKIYDYTGIDISEGLLEIARRNNPSADLRLMSLYEMDFEDDYFDGFWSAATLLHIPRDRIDEALSSIHRVVMNKGIGFISIKQGEGEVFEKLNSENENKRLFSYYNQEDFEKVLTRNSFEVLETQYRPSSERTQFLVFFVKIVKE